jgi:hypothetical protein
MDGRECLECATLVCIWVILAVCYRGGYVVYRRRIKHTMRGFTRNLLWCYIYVEQYTCSIIFRDYDQPAKDGPRLHEENLGNC